MMWNPNPLAHLWGIFFFTLGATFFGPMGADLLHYSGGLSRLAAAAISALLWMLVFYLGCWVLRRVTAHVSR